jgi:hypothetical protein
MRSQTDESKNYRGLADLFAVGLKIVIFGESRYTIEQRVNRLSNKFFKYSYEIRLEGFEYLHIFEVLTDTSLHL